MSSPETLVSDYRATWEAVIRGETALADLDRFFNVPCFMVSLDGQMTLYAAREDITAFNQSRLDAFRAGGVRHASLRAVDVLSQGPCLHLAMVNWELTRDDGSLERAWRHYYTILDGADGAAPAIVISAFQTGS